MHPVFDKGGYMKKILTAITVMICLMMGMFIPVHAEERSATDPVIELTQDGEAVVSSVADANQYATQNGASGNVLVLDGNLFAFVRNNYHGMDYSARKEFMARALRGVQTSGLQATTKSKVYNFIKERDPSTSQVVTTLANDYSGNLTDANETLKKWGVAQAISKIIGILCIAVFVFMSLSLVVDVLYLNIPFITSALDGMGDKSGRPKFVSGDAIYAWRETAGGLGNTNLVFLKKKFVSLLFVSFILVALISGKLFTIIGNIVDFAGYVLGLFGI